MKTLDRKKAEDLFYRIKSLGNEISHLGGVVQNPDFVEERYREELSREIDRELYGEEEW
jgi:hypothetical protein